MITSGYGNLTVIQNFSLEVYTGEIVAIIGSNDSGKSTLFATLARLITPTTGTIWLDGRDVTHQTLEALVQAGVAFIPQTRSAFADLSVEDNLKLGAHALPHSSDYLHQRDQVLSLFPRLAERGQHKVRHLSGGEQRMLEIARAMMARPRLMVLDEPSSGLAPYIRHQIFQNLHIFKRDMGLSIILLEQATPQAIDISDRGCVIAQGVKIFEGHRDALIEYTEIDADHITRPDYP